MLCEGLDVFVVSFGGLILSILLFAIVGWLTDLVGHFSLVLPAYFMLLCYNFGRVWRFALGGNWLCLCCIVCYYWMINVLI